MEEGSPSPKQRIKTEFIVALAAIFVSIATLAVYVYQARIMQNQLHTSVWPYVQWYYSNVGNEISLSVVNKGIGPALIKNTSMTLDGKKIDSNSDLFKTLVGTADFNFVNSTIKGQVISPGEKIELFHIYDSAYKVKIDSLLLAGRVHEFKYTVCFCSVYGDCWMTDGWNVKESSCD